MMIIEEMVSILAENERKKEVARRKSKNPKAQEISHLIDNYQPSITLEVKRLEEKLV